MNEWAVQPEVWQMEVAVGSACVCSLVLFFGVECERLCVRSGNIHLSRHWIYGTGSSFSLSNTASVSQLGLRVNWEKTKLSPVKRISFLGVELDSVSSEAPGAHGILSRGHATGFDAHETATTLASYPSPEMGMAPGHVSCEHHTFMSQDTQPLDRHCVPAVRSTLGTSVQMHRCHHRCFQDKLGCRLQRAGSVRGLDRPQTALAHQLPRVTGSASSPEEVPTFDSGQACVGLIRQHGDWGLQQPPGRCMLLLHVTTSPPSPAVEPTQTQVSACHSHSRRSQSYGRFSVTTGFARRQVEAPFPVGPNSTVSVQSQGGQGTDSLGSPLLAQQNLVLRPGAPGISSSLEHSSEEGPPLLGEGHNLAPAPRSLEPSPMVPGHNQENFRDLSPSVVNTLLQARAPSTRQLYDLNWCIFVNWCSSRGKDPRRCGIKEWETSKPSPLTVFCLEFGPADSHVVLRPWPDYVAKVPTTPFRDQVVTLQAFSSQEDDPNLTLLCPVHALRIYMEQTQPFRRSEQLFVCYGEQQKGKAVSKQRISHWLVNAIRTAYQARGLPCPLGVRAHSTRDVAALAALANGSSLTLKDRDSRPRLKITIVIKYLITFEPLVQSELYKKYRKAEILRFFPVSRLSHLDFQRLRSERDYIIIF
ncbi:Protein P [Labeo rohita]|uniref:Protein P n=1 Tax=Labeo rohita TaxID=84645 RepID=A0ABQ8L4B5_LABRO|nr:Protein P [Labeo rohita]